MKKLTLIIAAAFLIVISGYAQKKAYEPTKFWDHWFFQAQVGASYTLSEYYSKASFGDIITPHVALSVGKYFSPVAGARLQVGGWESKNYYEYTLSQQEKNGTYKVKYIQTNVDGLLNITNLFMPYYPDRVFNLVGIVGIGYAHGFSVSNVEKIGEIENTNSVVPRIGLQGDFRISDAVDLNLEVIGNLYPDNFNGVKEGVKYDGVLNALVGITYNFTHGGFKTVDIIDPAALNALNAKVNEQKSLLANKDGEIGRLKDELSRKPEPKIVIEKTKEIKEQTDVLMNAVVVFRLGSAELEQNQDINVYNAARYLKDNPRVNVIVTGYADKNTGTPAINQKLSEQRAQAVAKILIDKYGISSSRITTKASGDKEQLFPTDQWNRVVVFTAVTK
ncbi:MAG: OmpA family protein [Prevotella sp.]|jgi:outer membrane protein OmpA-like peptidoglycan-associated protein|nr:OmpA family protein [Prevotella sp.]